jgi:glycosyltransferase involved in cell wall biosynthesis
MEYYVVQYAKSIAWLGNFSYWLFAKLPARYANANAAPTLCFLDSHIRHQAKGCMRFRIPSGVADGRFKVDSDAQLIAERRDLERICGGSPGDCICIMVQRLAPEKDTMHALEALLQLRDGPEALAAAKAGKGKGKASVSSRAICSIDGKRPIRLVVAGDGPARKSLVNFAERFKLPVTFTGNVKNDRLPPLYRAADVFVTCSTSET